MRYLQLDCLLNLLLLAVGTFSVGGLYLNVSTQKFFDGSCPICDGPVYVTPSRSSVNPIYSLRDGLLEDAILFRKRNLVFEDDRIHVPRRQLSSYASPFMEVVDTTMKECASMLEMKMEKLRQEWTDSNPNAVEVLSVEMQDSIDDTFRGLVQKWREHVGEYCNEYDLRPSFFDATYYSCVPRKTEWMERWIEHTINGHTHSSGILRLCEVWESKQTPRAKMSVKALPTKKNVAVLQSADTKSHELTEFVHNLTGAPYQEMVLFNNSCWRMCCAVGRTKLCYAELFAPAQCDNHLLLARTAIFGCTFLYLLQVSYIADL